jgi:fructose/tagatose bisphosphate aldolase
MGPEEYPEYIKNVYQFIDDVTQGIGQENLAAIAFDFGTEHVARRGQVLTPKYDLLEQYQNHGLVIGVGPYAVVGHGGTSLGTEEIMNSVRGLLGKINKATQLKRGDLEYLVEYLDDNRGLINANLRGDTEEEASDRLGREITKKQIDGTHHPKYTVFGPQTRYMETVQWYMECLGSKDMTPDLYERGILKRITN